MRKQKEKERRGGKEKERGKEERGKGSRGKEKERRRKGEKEERREEGREGEEVFVFVINNFGYSGGWVSSEIVLEKVHN
jgi:hypothetical protein